MGGTASEFILLLDDLGLGFAPNYTVVSYKKELLSNGSGDLATHVTSAQTHFLPHRPQIITYRANAVVDKQSLRWEKVSELIQQNFVTVRGLVRDIRQRLQKPVENLPPQEGEIELKHVVEFPRLANKLPIGSMHNKTRQHKESPSFDITFYDASVAIPYGKDSKKRQKFDLIGFVVHSEFHYVAYV